MCSSNMIQPGVLHGAGDVVVCWRSQKGILKKVTAKWLAIALESVIRKAGIDTKSSSTSSVGIVSKRRNRIELPPSELAGTSVGSNWKLLLYHSMMAQDRPVVTWMLVWLLPLLELVFSVPWRVLLMVTLDPTPSSFVHATALKTKASPYSHLQAQRIANYTRTLEEEDDEA